MDLNRRDGAFGSHGLSDSGKPFNKTIVIDPRLVGGDNPFQSEMRPSRASRSGFSDDSP
jgi:hypothetical protein